MKLFLGRGAWWLPLFAVIGGCSIYDSSLLGTGSGGAGAGAGSGPGPGGTGGTGGIPTSSTGGGGTGGIATTSTGGGGATGGGGSGTGGTVACSAPGDCPGMDTTCKTRTCDAHVCGAHLTDKNIACTETANGVCDGDGKCVECNDGTQCAMSHICAANNTCAAASCSDGVQNGSETDSDCGGSCAKKCGFNEHCMQGSDCKGGTCTTQVCVATCSDGVQNGSETDSDCGGSCPKCADGKHCSGPGDCTSGSCAAGTCQFVLLISEIKTRGVAGGSDEFVELYNPTSSELVLDGGWSIEVRSSTSSSYTVKAFGSGVHIPSHHHYLLSGADYPGGATCGTCPGTPCGGVPCADFTALPGIKDAASVAILHSGAIVDAVCFSYNQTTHDAIVNGIGYVCEGNLASNLPHNDVSGAGSNVDVGIERKPGGGAGNATDSGDSAADFNVGATSNPQNLLSGPT